MGCNRCGRDPFFGFDNYYDRWDRSYRSIDPYRHDYRRRFDKEFDYRWRHQRGKKPYDFPDHYW